MSKTALLILDVQNEFVDPQGKIGSTGYAKLIEERRIIPNIAHALAVFRAKKLPVAFVNVGYRADYADTISRSARLKHLMDMNAIVLGTWATEFPEAIKPLPTEITFTKRGVNPFFNTALLSWLQRQGVDAMLGGLEPTIGGTVESALHGVFGLGVLVSMFTAITASRTLLLAIKHDQAGRVMKFLFHNGFGSGK